MLPGKRLKKPKFCDDSSAAPAPRLKKPRVPDDSSATSAPTFARFTDRIPAFDPDFIGGGGAAGAPAPARRPTKPPRSLEAENDDLQQVLKVGVELEVKNSEGKGRGLFAKFFIKKGQMVTDYDGHRVDPISGDAKMICSKMRRCLGNLPKEKVSQLSSCKYNKTWAVAVNRKSGARVVIDGSVAASELLDDVPNRGGIGAGSILNSSKKPNCKLVCCTPPPDQSFSNANFFFANEEEKSRHVIQATEDIMPGQELTHAYSFAAHRQGNCAAV